MGGLLADQRFGAPVAGSPGGGDHATPSADQQQVGTLQPGAVKGVGGAAAPTHAGARDRHLADPLRAARKGDAACCTPQWPNRYPAPPLRRQAARAPRADTDHIAERRERHLRVVGHAPRPLALHRSRR
jgi:hypothetical protein